MASNVKLETLTLSQVLDGSVYGQWDNPHSLAVPTPQKAQALRTNPLAKDFELPAQVVGCITGAVLANIMFSRAAVTFSTKHRATGAHFVAEIVATVGLLVVIFATARSGRSASTPAAVGAYIGAAYFFTSSTSFANPAITIGRMFSNTFAGIAPSSAPSFVGAQVLGWLVGYVLVRALYPALSATQAATVVIPHPAGGETTS